MRRCEVCGKYGNGWYCSKCGGKMVEPEEYAPGVHLWHQHEVKSPFGKFILFIMILVIVGIVFFGFSYVMKAFEGMF